MILDTIGQADHYTACHPLFKEAFDFLQNILVTGKLPKEGKTEIRGASLYVMNINGQPRDKADALLETHRRYIDIQFTFAGGADHIGWRTASGLQGNGYDPEKDIEFYMDKPLEYIDVPEGYFAVFFPEDAHAPLSGGAGKTSVQKLVVKVAVKP